MKKIIKRTTAAFIAATMAVSALSCLCSVAADEEVPKTITVKFEWEEEGVSPTKETDLTHFDTITTEKSYIDLPHDIFEREGHTFSGWTVDGIHGYAPGYVVSFTLDYLQDYFKDSDEIVFKACWANVTDKPHTVTYVTEYNGEELEKPEFLKNGKYAKNEIFEPNYTTVMYDDIFSSGLTDGERVYSFGEQILMPDHDIVLYPIFFKRINLTYSAGDVDRLNGNDSMTVKKNEGSKIELATPDRFSRKGFNIVGWKSSVDGEVYAPEATFIVPSEDFTLTAVWEAKKYNVVFIPGNKAANIKVPGKTDEAIICPEPGITVAGKHFAGWKDNTGKIYAAGSEYVIPGADPGLGISLNAVWEDGEASAETTAPATTTTTPATTTTTTTKAPTAAKLIGDANCDNKVTVADAVAILQFIANKDKFALSADGLANADCFNPGDGVTGKDALAIQQLDAQLIKELPVKE
ncbi:MAG: InlB B-repeat-containing protein [Ruminococcus sp.]|nr:InlB B-repeat-containing protein [Ruminococcus sp.]